MGSFYSTCSVSGMTLSHQKTSVLLLIPKHDTSFENNLNMIVSNDGCQSFFSPFGFPIHGNYDDYGYIENIQLDRGVRAIEDYFGVDIQNLLKAIGDNRNTPSNIKNREIYEKLGKTYIRTEVLEYLQDGWDKIDIENGPEYGPDRRIKKLLDSLNNKLVSEEEKDILFEKLGNGEITEEEKKVLLNIIGHNPIGENSYISSLVIKNMFKELPITSEFKDDILKQWMMICSLNGLNRLLLPSVYGSQGTNWVETYKLNNFINDLLVDDMKEFEVNSNEEEDIVKNHKLVKRVRKINTII